MLIPTGMYHLVQKGCRKSKLLAKRVVQRRGPAFLDHRPRGREIMHNVQVHIEEQLLHHYSVLFNFDVPLMGYYGFLADSGLFVRCGHHELSARVGGRL